MIVGQEQLSRRIMLLQHYAGGAVSLRNVSNAVSGAVIESCRSLAIAGVSGFIALRTGLSSGGISGADVIGSGLTCLWRRGQMTAGSGDSGTGGTVASNHAASTLCWWCGVTHE